MAFEASPLVLTLIVFLGLLTLAFAIKFLVPALLLQMTLGRLQKRLRAISDPTLTALTGAFTSAGPLRAIWQEYSATLHHQTEFQTSTGLYETVSLRSTVPAEYVFTSEAVFESRLGSEFFKHLPGVLTGIGIIGTFLGLINGLAAFQISQNPSAVAESLNHLMGAVHQAFLVSASAIICAVVITFFEKICIATLTSKLSSLCLKIDGFFRSGTGEEYLGRIVRSSESAEKEARILKDALVSELEIILDRVTTRQISESGLQAENLRQHIVDGLTESLSAPMAAISDVAQRLGGSQVDAVNSLLTDTLAQFSAQLRDMFANQMSGTTEMQRQATLALQTILSDVGTMADRLSRASEGASSTIAQQVADALSAMEHRQRGMIDVFREAVDSMRSDIAANANSSTANVVATVDALGTQVAALIDTLQHQVKSVSAKDEARLEALSEHYATIQSDVAARAESSTAKVIATVDALGANVASLIDTLQNQVVSASAKDEARMEALTQHTATIQAGVAASADSSNSKVIATVEALGIQVASLIDTLQNQVASASAKDELRLEALTKHYASVQSGVAASADSANAKVIDTVDALGAQVTSLIGTLQNQVTSASVKDELRLDALNRHYASVQSNMDSAMRSTFEQLAGMREQLTGTIDAFRQISGSSFDKLVTAAQSVETAASHFAEAGSKTADVLSRSNQLVSELSQVSRALSNAGDTVNSLMTDYKSVREEIARLVAELALLVNTAKRDVGLTESLIAKLEAAGAKLGTATSDAEDYLFKVSTVLGEAFTTFSTQVEQSLRGGNRAFQQELTDATRLLKAQIADLGEVLETMPARRTA